VNKERSEPNNDWLGSITIRFLPKKKGEREERSLSGSFPFPTKERERNRVQKRKEELLSHFGSMSSLDEKRKR